MDKVIVEDPMMTKNSWWRWDWNTDIQSGLTLEYDRVTRWRRGWITLKALDALEVVGVVLFLPCKSSKFCDQGLILLSLEKVVLLPREE